MAAADLPGWLRRLGGRRVKADDAPEVVEAPWSGRTDAAADLPAALTLPLERIEAAALEVYARHGLPTRPGLYRLDAQARRWIALPPDMDAQARFDLVLDPAHAADWRCVAMEALGAAAGSEAELVRASRLLSACARLRRRAAGTGGGNVAQDLAEAIRLGAEWSRLDAADEAIEVKVVRPGLT